MAIAPLNRPMELEEVKTLINLEVSSCRALSGVAQLYYTQAASHRSGRRSHDILVSKTVATDFSLPLEESILPNLVLPLFHEWK